MYIIKMWVILESLVSSFKQDHKAGKVKKRGVIYYLIKGFIPHYTLNATSQDILTIRKGMVLPSHHSLLKQIVCALTVICIEKTPHHAQIISIIYGGVTLPLATGYNLRQSV